MKKFISILLFFMLLVLTIPSISLLGKNKTPNPVKQSSDDILMLDRNTGEVLTLSVKEYIRGTVAAEMPVSFHAEALKAQAVAAHTYALRQISEQLKNPDEELKGAYISNDPAKFQAYISVEEMKNNWQSNFESNYKKLCDAVDSVIDEVITYNDKPIAAAFHAVSCGQTEDSANVWGKSLDYLKPVESEGDKLSSSLTSTAVFKENEIETILLQSFPDFKPEEEKTKWFSILEKSPSGYVTKVKVCNLELSGSELRNVLKLKSSNFSVEYNDGSFTFTTLGYGHGVGMSQYGADFLARQGKDYKEILHHYYTNVEIVNIKNSDAQ